jgi:copper chaperone CopZ
MIHRNLQLAAILDVAGAIRVMDALRAVPGVGTVDAESGSDVVSVNFDLSRTSSRALSQALTRAGHPEHVHQAGTSSCCGACGG